MSHFSDFKLYEIRLQSTLNIPQRFAACLETKHKGKGRTPVHFPTSEHSQTLVAIKDVALVTKRFQLQEKPTCSRVKPEYVNYRKNCTDGLRLNNGSTSIFQLYDRTKAIHIQ